MKLPKLQDRNRGWTNMESIPTKAYDCPYCGNRVASTFGWDGGGIAWIYVCSHCLHPTYFTEEGTQIPGIAAGELVDNVPLGVGSAYGEARDALAAGAPTASVLMSRKLLMNISVAQGADEGKIFAEYVDYLATSGYVPPNGKPWVDHIRQKGNEATHEIPQATSADATELITFLEMLLRLSTISRAACQVRPRRRRFEVLPTDLSTGDSQARGDVPGKRTRARLSVTTLGAESPDAPLSRNRLTFGFRPRSALHSLLQQVRVDTQCRDDLLYKVVALT